MNMQFERPIFLLLLALLVPVVLLAWRSRRNEETWKWWTSLLLRTLVVLGLVGAIAQPSFVRRGEALTTVAPFRQAYSRMRASFRRNWSPGNANPLIAWLQ